MLIAAVPPLLLKTPANPEGLPIEVFDGLRAGLFNDRSQFYRDFALQFYGANRPGSKVSQGMLDQFWIWSMQSGLHELLRMRQGVLRDGFHRGPEAVRRSDAAAPWRGRPDRTHSKDSSMKSARLIKGAKDVYYPGAPHGLTSTHQDQINAELLQFLRSSPAPRARERMAGTSVA